MKCYPNQQKCNSSLQYICLLTCINRQLSSYRMEQQNNKELVSYKKCSLHKELIHILKCISSSHHPRINVRLPPCIIWIISCGILYCQAVCSMLETLLLILVIYIDICSACTENDSLEKVVFISDDGRWDNTIYFTGLAIIIVQNLHTNDFRYLLNFHAGLVLSNEYMLLKCFFFFLKFSSRVSINLYELFLCIVVVWNWGF